MHRASREAWKDYTAQFCPQSSFNWLSFPNRVQENWVEVIGSAGKIIQGLDTMTEEIKSASQSSQRFQYDLDIASEALVVAMWYDATRANSENDEGAQESMLLLRYMRLASPTPFAKTFTKIVSTVFSKILVVNWPFREHFLTIPDLVEHGEQLLAACPATLSQPERENIISTKMKMWLGDTFEQRGYLLGRLLDSQEEKRYMRVEKFPWLGNGLEEEIKMFLAHQLDFDAWDISPLYKALRMLVWLEQLKDDAKRDIERLCSWLTKNEVVPFIGAGVSCPAGYPSWWKFLNDCAANCGDPDAVVKVREMLGKDQYQEAAEYLDTVTSMSKNIEHTFGPTDKAKMKGVMGGLLPEFQGTIITTNYDPVIEACLPDKVNIIIPSEINPQGEGQGDRVRKMIDDVMDRDQPVLIKLHGTYNLHDTHVLTKKQYKKAYANSPVPTVVQAMTGLRSVLFIGCSLNNDEYLRYVQRDAGHPNFAMMRDGVQQEYAGMNIKPIFYPDSKVDSHEYLPILLRFMLTTSRSDRSPIFEARTKLYDFNSRTRIFRRMGDSDKVKAVCEEALVDLESNTCRRAFDSIRDKFNYPEDRYAWIAGMQAVQSGAL